MNVRSLYDLQESDPKKKEEEEGITSSFTGGEKSALAVQNPTSKQSHQLRMHKMVLFRNGMQLDEAFMPLGQEEISRIADDIKNGFVPTQLKQVVGADGLLNVSLENRPTEDYAAPQQTEAAKPAAVIAFQGEGRSLGGSTSASSQEAAAPTDPLRGSVTISDGSTRTDLVFRFHDGSRARQAFSSSEHTVEDLYHYVGQCAPLAQGFQLIAGFPPKNVSRDRRTIGEAGLCGELVTQKAC